MTNGTISQELAERIRRIENGLIPDLKKRTETAALADRMEHHKTPGVSVAVLHDDRVEWAKGYGLLESGGEAPVTTETLFQAGSISKPVAAVAALSLVDEGRIDLDEDVNAYLTSWKIPANDGWQPKVTLRQLLSHTGGTTVHGFPGYARGVPVPTLVQVLDGETPANTPAVRVNALPGTLHRYSGGGTSIVQLMLIDLLGAPFPEIARERVLDPIGMTDSTYEQPLPEHRWASTATAHPNGARPLEGQWHTYPEMAAAGLWTTASDLARFALELQRAKAGRSNKVLSSRIVTEMMTAQAEEPVGLGVFLESEGENLRFGHGGWDEGFVAKMIAYRDQGFGAVVMLNSNQGHPLMDEIVHAIARDYGWADYLPKERTPAAIDPKLLDLYSGEYELKPGLRLRVARSDDGLLLQLAGQDALPIHPSSETRFYAEAIEAEIEFNRSEGERIDGLTLYQSRREKKAKRL